MKPLTLEELQKMDGKPAYWADDESYGIVSVDSAGKWAGIPFFRGRKNGANFEYDIASREMDVYATKPERINREAWELCDLCKSCFTCAYVLSSLGAEPCFSCEQFSNHKPIAFCSHCGRPLTDAAWEMLEKRVGGSKE